MSDIIKLKKGLDINLFGQAALQTTVAPTAESYAVAPPDFEGVTPKLLVREGDKVKAGTPLFFNKNSEKVLFCSPVSGTVSAIVRGEKRKVLFVTVTPDAEQQYEQFDVKPIAQTSREQLKELLLGAGLWPCIIQRPYGIIASPDDTPKAIFVSGFDTAPLAPDMNYVLADSQKDLQAGFDALRLLTDGKVHLSLKAGEEGVLDKIAGVQIHRFSGAHPAGNVGVQIHHIDPINKGEKVWTVNVQDVAVIGRLMNTGHADMTKTIVVAGSEIEKPQYVKIISGASIKSVTDVCGVKADGETSVRLISGNVLTGVKVEPNAYMTFYANALTAIPEGDKYEMLGWAKIVRPKKFSVSRAYFSWLCPKHKYNLDTNLNGGRRAMIVTGLYEKYLPMDIYPMYLLKAILAGDIDKMENLGIYEVVEEDLALCEFVDPSKTEIQSIIRQGINLMIKELN